jgi:hypothetical protein
MNTRPHLAFEEFLLLRDMAQGGEPDDRTPKSYIDRLLSLGYIRPVEGDYVVTGIGRKRLRSGS